MDSERAQELLFVADARDHSLSRSVLNGRVLILRRVIEPDGHLWESSNVPTYLVLPGGPELLAGGSVVFPPAETLAMRRAQVEFAAAEMITQLTDLEAEAANRLHLGQRDLEIWNNHLKVYNAVVERGAFLWDALSTHLMIRWGAPFENAHNAVDMLHQVLQQAVADLRHIATLTHQAVADIRQAAVSLQDSYDRRIGERPSPDEPGLRAALTETGLFGRAARSGDEILSRAERVKTAYDDLLRAIAGAFDERRVRELDGTQKASLLVGFFAASFGLVTVLDAIISMKPDETSADITILGSWPYLDEIGLWTSAGIGFFVLLALSILFMQVNNIGKLGTGVFRDLYQGYGWWPVRRWWRRLRGQPAWWPRTGLWRFLKDTSTDRQKRLRLDTPGDQWQHTWNTHDRRSAEQLAAIWDAAKSLPNCERHDRYKKDIKGLSRLIEQWGAHSLVLTERARVMHWFDLPNLTCLYRCCTRIERSFLELSDIPPVTMVADIDMLLSLMRLGFSRHEAQHVDAWLTASEFSTAAQAHERVRSLQLQVGMNPEQRQATLDRIAGRRH